MAHVISGRVNELLEPWVEIGLADGSKKFECLVDTGFAGTLMLPKELLLDVETPLVGLEKFVGVAGHTFTARTTELNVQWLGDEFVVPVVISEEGDALLGGEMLVDAVLTIDYARGTVKIEKE